MVKPNHHTDSEKNSSPESAGLYKLQKRRIQKVVVERHRRDRINTALETLKAMLHTPDPNSNADRELDKAQILEMTVSYLRAHLQHPQPQAGSAHQESPPSSSLAAEAAYSAGFHHCLAHIQQIMADRRDLPDHMRSRLLSHLSRQTPTGSPAERPCRRRASAETPETPRSSSASSAVLDNRRSAFRPANLNASYSAPTTPNGNTRPRSAEASCPSSSAMRLNIEIPTDNHRVSLSVNCPARGDRSASSSSSSRSHLANANSLLAIPYPVPAPLFNMNQYVNLLNGHYMSPPSAHGGAWRPW